MLLAIDIGNTRTKAAVFEGSTILKQFSLDQHSLKNQILLIKSDYQNITDIVLSSVGNETWRQITFQDISLHIVDRTWKFPFKNMYATPDTLGIDRMVLASGAVMEFPTMNRLIIDAGTCITYDFIDSADQYLGGAISPGIRLRYECLHNNTAKLPLLTFKSIDHYIGNSTEDAIHSGVLNGISYEIDGFINKYLQNVSNFIIILTGGDADFLAERLKNTIFANSNFLLESLNRTFQYQTSND